MRYSAAIPTPIHLQAVKHLVRKDRQEDLCFALWNPSQGKRRFTACVRELVLPEVGERDVHGNVSFNPSYFQRALSLARSENCGLALMHSHLGPGWQGMSRDDINAEESHARAALAATDLPFLGLTVGTDGAWSARFWPRTAPKTYTLTWCESVRVAGDQFLVTYDVTQRPPPEIRVEQLRTVSAWGEAAQADLARLRVGVIGLGSVGAIVAEALARMGVIHVKLLDFDRVELHNLDRLLHTTRNDALSRRPKVEVMGEALRESATAEAFEVEEHALSVVEEDGFRIALDCDILFSCVDRPWPRFVLNLIAYAHLIPIVDGGLALTPFANRPGLRRGTWKAHVAAPTRRCLECLRQYDPADVSLERSGMLDAKGYIDSLPETHTLRRNENVFAFSLSVASLEIEQFLRMVIPTSGNANTGAVTEHFVTGHADRDLSGCNPGCPYCAMVASGDRSGYSGITGAHPAAENMRASVQAKAPSSPRSFLKTLWDAFRAWRGRR